MPTVKVFIRTTSNNKDANVRFRYSNGRNIQLFHKSEIFVNPTVFDEKKGCVKAKVVFDTKKRTQIDTAIVERTKLIRRLCDDVVTSDKTIFNSEWLELILKFINHICIDIQ